MLDDFQKEILRVIFDNRSKYSYVAGGSALNRTTPRLSADIDLFHASVALIDESIKLDLQSLVDIGYTTSRVRETSTLREWLVSDRTGRSTKLQWTRDTAWLYFPPVSDPEFGFVLTFEDLAVNKICAAADRGRIRDFHDLMALDLLGVPPWVLALAAMGKDAELSPPAVLDRCRRLLKQAGADDEDPDYAGPSVAWAEVAEYMSGRLEEDRGVLESFGWIDWAGALPVLKSTGRIPLNLTPAGLTSCVRKRASPTGSWPTSPSLSSDMLLVAHHPELRELVLDIPTLLNRRRGIMDDSHRR